MPIRIVRLGTPKQPREGLRLGTVRRPPRGVKKSRYAAENWFDLWLPILAPSAELVAAAHTWVETPAGRKRFAARYASEMARGDASHVLDLLAALSHHVNFSVGCYCADEARCHRRVLRRLLEARGASVLR
jgi:uncharacterized protein YeaO (DUF488 family)